MEIDQFIKLQVQCKVLIKTLLTKSERYLLKNQRQFVLAKDLDSKDRETSDENAVENFDMESKYFQSLIEGTKLRQSASKQPKQD